MTRVTFHGGRFHLVAIDAKLHIQGNLFDHNVLVRDLSVTRDAVRPGFHMPGVAEDDKVRYAVDLFGRNNLFILANSREFDDLDATLQNSPVADHALTGGRKSSSLP
jgi:hypothetical protein